MNSSDRYPNINYNAFAEKALVFYIDDNVDAICNNELINRFFKLVNSQFKVYHNVSDYANQLSVSPKNLLLLCKKEGLKNPSDIIQSKILLEAKKQLLFTNRNIKNICFDLGFSDPAYFSRFFKRHIDITAQDFRNQCPESLKIVKMEKSATK